MKKLFPLLLCLVIALPVLPCSTFLLNKNGQLVFGRNYDWVSGNGVIVVNTAGLQKTSFTPGSHTGINWVSQFGSVTFNQFGKEFPHGGMNEKGLVVELMWLHGTEYPAPDKRAAMNELQWIQYQLDNCTTIEEVIANDTKIRIEHNSSAPLHYLVADASGRAATIEFLNGKMVVHKGNELRYPVLTNSTYEQSIAQLDPATRATESNNSLDRFTQACKMLDTYQQGDDKTPPVDYAFNMLNKVSQGKYTKWSIVYDITNKQIHFITIGNTQRRTISFSGLDLTCGQQAMSVDINAPLKGNISGNLTTLSAEQNQQVAKRSAEESRSHVQIPEAAIAALASYFSTIRCK
ncbi:MAG: linear amide C-N hydrolase [Chitinophagaceae bacterium]|nr:linear amide C-N hydrolase [Chitinophagaceae bacterium]